MPKKDKPEDEQSLLGNNSGNKSLDFSTIVPQEEVSIGDGKQGMDTQKSIEVVAGKPPIPPQEEEQDDEQTVDLQDQATPLTVDEDKLVPITIYNKEEAEEASKQLAEGILAKIKSGDNNPTAITDLSKQSHVIRELKAMNVEVNVTFGGDFSDIMTHISSDDSLNESQQNEILKALITDVALANTINFTSKESAEEFIKQAGLSGVPIDTSKIKVNDSALEESQTQGEQSARGLDRLTTPLNDGQRKSTIDPPSTSQHTPSQASEKSQNRVQGIR